MQFAAHHNYVTYGLYVIPHMQMLKSQYTEKEGYYIRRPPKMFAFKDSGDTSDSCLSIKVKDEGCVMAADPENKQVRK